MAYYVFVYFLNHIWQPRSFLFLTILTEEIFLGLFIIVLTIKLH